VTSRPDGGTGRVVSYDPETGVGVIRLSGGARSGGARPGDIALWKMRKPRAREGVLAAPAIDDLAGCAAVLAALDRARRRPELRHFGALLTRAEEAGFVGAIHAAKHRTIPSESRIINVEASRELADARIGDGPVVRVGDAATVFDGELTNRIDRAAKARGLKHQRRLMDGGSCEATAFGAYGYRSAGLCLPLGNHHNRGNLDEVEAGGGPPIPKLEEISLGDFHSLVDLILIAVEAIDREDPIRAKLDRLHEAGRRLLGGDAGR